MKDVITTEGVSATGGPGRRRRGRLQVGVALGVLGLAGAGLIAIAVAAWSAAGSSAAAQGGQRAVATVTSVHVTSVSGRGGTQYTSHYLMSFETRTGQRITTTVLANGDDPCSCTRTVVAYDPSRPNHAELAGAPLHTAGEAIAVSAIAAAVVVIEALLVVSVRRFGRRTREGNGVLPRPRRRGLLLGTPFVGLIVGVGVAAAFIFNQGPGPSLGLARHVVASAVAGRGTTDCLALPPSTPADLPVNATWANTAIAVALGTPVPATSPGYPHWYPAKDAFDPLLGHAYFELGGGTPPPGQPSSAYGAWTAALTTPGARGVDIWALSSPQAAARFADAYLASLCYRFAHHSGLSARTAAPPMPAPPGEICVMTGLPNRPALAVARCVLPIGRYVIRGEDSGTLATQQPQLLSAAAGIVARAVGGGRATAP